MRKEIRRSVQFEKSEDKSSGNIYTYTARYRKWHRYIGLRINSLVLLLSLAYLS